MRFAGPVAIFTRHSGIWMRTVPARLAMAYQALLFEIQWQWPAERRFQRGGRIFGKTGRQREPMARHRMQIACLDQRRTRQSNTCNIPNSEEKTQSVTIAAYYSFNGKLQRAFSRSTQ